jgi:hypothetical protein
MSGVVVKVNQTSVPKSTRFGLENALARHVRRRWPKNTICLVQSEWDLEAGEARGVVYGTASRTTLNKIIRHRRGGWRLGLLMLEGVTGQSLGDFIISERERLRHEREQYEERDRHLVAMAADLRLGDRLGLGGPYKLDAGKTGRLGE